MDNTNSSSFLKILIVIYLLILTVAGQYNSQISYADFFSVFFLFYIFFNLKFLKKNFLFITVILITYTILIGLFSLITEKNTPFILFVMSIKMINFMTILTFGYLCSQLIVRTRHIYIPFITLIIFLYFVINLYLGEKTYYGYVGLPSINSPSNAGISLASVTIFGLIMFFFDNKKIPYKSITNLSIFILFILTLLVQTRATFYSLATILTFLIFYYTFFINKIYYKKLFSILIVVFLLLIFVININLFVEFFPRMKISNLVYNFEYRFNKAQVFYSEMCEALTCSFFGTGIGSHAFYNGHISLSIDNLFSKFRIEWGILGSFLWLIYFLNLTIISSFDYKSKGKTVKLILPTFIFLLFGSLISFSSEFIFVSYSGSYYGFFLGALYGYFFKKEKRIVYKI